MRELYNKKMNLFHETAATKNALKGQILAAIGPIYLKELKIRATETIKSTISQILTYCHRQV